MAHVGSWSWDGRSGKLEWSEELYRIYGRDPKLPPPDYWQEQLSTAYAPESMVRLNAAVEILLKNGTPYELEVEVIRPDGTLRWVSARGEPMRDETRRIVGIRGTAQDITQLKQLQKMREERTSIIAHDLRQPIGVVKMCSDVWPKFHAGGMSEKENITNERLRFAAHSLSRMVDDLLDVSQMDAHHLVIDQKRVDLRELVVETVERLSEVTQGFHVSISEKSELPPAFIDQVRVEQVLGNLISNAAKYGKKGTEIEIQMSRLEDDRILVSVTNYGQGIEKDEIPKLFSRFTRSKSMHGTGVPGLGLGLYICKGLVESHGGQIWVESEPGNKTTFYFTLPMAKSELKLKSA